MSQFETITVNFADHVGRIVINRPDVLNALNEQVISELETVIKQDVAQQNPRAVVLEGAGERAFIAGADIAAMQKMSPPEAEAFGRKGQALTRLLESLPQLTIAKVDGFALGGGCEMAMACDIVVCSDSAKFGQPEINLGIIAGFGGTQRLVRRVGLAVATDMLCAGRNLSGTEAAQLGLAARVVEADKLEDEVRRVLKGVLKGGPAAVAATKRLLRVANDHGLDAGLGEEASTFKSCFEGTEAQEGLSAFLEKRSASFVGKC